MESIHLLSKRGRVIGVKNKKNNINIIASSTIFYYFLQVVFIANVFLVVNFLLTQKMLYTIYSSSFLLIVVIAITIEKRALFIKISYPCDDIINLNGYLLNYGKNEIRIYLIGIQSLNKFTAYNYMLHVVENDNLIFSIKINYSKEKKIREFIDNLIFDENFF